MIPTDIRSHNNLVVKREHLGFHQSHVAELLGLTCSTISSYEVGRRTPNLPAAIGLEFVLGCSLSELYPGVARAAAEAILPLLQKLSVSIEWEENSLRETRKAALPVIAERLSKFTSLA